MSSDFLSLIKEGPVKIKGKRLGVTDLLSLTLALDTVLCKLY